MQDLDKIQKLVGSITENDLEHVDCSVGEHLGIFVPSTGFCKYAITPQHTHPGYMFNIFVLDNQKVIKQQIEVDENHFLACVLSPMIPHCEEGTGSFNRYYAIMIDASYFEKVFSEYTDKKIPEYIWHQFKTEAEILIYVKQFIAEYEKKEDNYEIVLENLTSIITHKLIRSMSGSEKTGSSTTNDEEVSSEIGIEKVQQYIQQAFGEKLTIKKIAEVANMSVSHLDRKFKSEYGCSPIQYLNKIRIEKAKILLKNNHMLITEIAFYCGYSNASSFSGAFLKQEGVSPKQYRKVYSIPKND